ncbi:MAG: hypothetical protein LBJ10_11280, partial [Clostridiales bacterium]|nr:hypothetical protein [Clostridiales bacterium]
SHAAKLKALAWRGETAQPAGSACVGGSDGAYVSDGSGKACASGSGSSDGACVSGSGGSGKACASGSSDGSGKACASGMRYGRGCLWAIEFL